MKRKMVLVHGIDDTARCLHTMAQFFRNAGFEVFEFEYKPNDGSARLELLAEHLKSFVEERVVIRDGREGVNRDVDSDDSAKKVVLVGFSMGGIVSRYYVQRMGGDAYVSDLITLASPHHGTLWASFFWRHGVKQMRLGSSFLKDLNGDVSIFSLRQKGTDLKPADQKSGHDKVRCLSVYTPFDLMIVPAQSSRVNFALCKRVWVLAHPLMIRSRRVFAEILKALG